MVTSPALSPAAPEVGKLSGARLGIGQQIMWISVAFYELTGSFMTLSPC
jgi:hypothetical protein